MLHLQKHIAKLLQDEFNKNTLDLDFEVSLYSVKTDSKLQKIINVPNTYSTERKRFIPVIIEDIDGEYKEVQTFNSVEPFINLSLLIPTDENDINNQIIEETYEKVGLALDEMRVRLLGNPIPLGEKCFILPEEYQLQLGQTINIGAFGLSIDLEFTDKSSGRLLRMFDQAEELTKNSTEVLFNNEVLFEYTPNKRYKLELKIINEQDDLQWFVDGQEVGSIITNRFLGPFNIQFGGVLTKIYSFLLLDNASEVVLTLKDFESIPNPIEVNGQNITTSVQNEKFVLQWGSLGIITLNFTIPNPTSQQITFGDGLNYQEFELALSSTIDDQVFTSNLIKYFLNGVRVYPFFREHSYLGEVDSAQTINEKMTKHIVSQSTIATEFTLFLKPEKIILDLAKKITSNEPEANEIYNLEVIFPLFGREYEILVTQGGLAVDGNEAISVSFKLDLADDILKTV